MKPSKAKNPSSPPPPSQRPPPPSLPAPVWFRALLWAVFGLAGLLLFWALLQTAGYDADLAEFRARGWGDYAAVIVGNKTVALWHAALMTVLAGVMLWLLAVARPAWRRAAAWGLVLAVAGDALWLSRHYIKTMPLSALEENDVLRILKTAMPEHRAALISQDGFYNHWLTYLFPYHHILTMNVTQMPRMPVEYKRFLETVGRNPVRLWQLSAVRFVLGPSAFWGQVQNDPALREALELVFAYNVEPAEMGVTVVPATQAAPGQHVILRLTKPAPRFALLGGWDSAGDDEALRRLAAPDRDPFVRLLVAPEATNGLPMLAGTGMVGQVQMESYRPGRIKLRVSADQPALLRVAEKYDRDWRAWIDGRPEPVRRADFIVQGVLIAEPGLHEVELRYAPDRRQLVFPWLGMLLCLGAGVWVAVKSGQGSGLGVSEGQEGPGFRVRGEED